MAAYRPEADLRLIRDKMTDEELYAIAADKVA